MATLVSLLIILLIFALFISGFFLIAISNAKRREKKELQLLENLPSDITIKAIVQYNIGRPQGRFLKIKSFQGGGILYVRKDKLIFEDIFGNEDHTYDLKTCKISLVKNKINGIKNAFKVVDHEAIIFFYIEKGVFILNTVEENASTRDLFLKLKKAKVKIAAKGDEKLAQIGNRLNP